MQETDAEKSDRLRTAADYVVRVREDPLECLHPHDVVVPFQIAPEQAAVIVLEHLVALGAMPASTAEEYRELSGPRATERAEQHLATLRDPCKPPQCDQDEAACLTFGSARPQAFAVV